MATLRVHRRAYRRADGTYVRGARYSINNKGRPGHGKKLFTLHRGGLSRYGYSVQHSAKSRHMALLRALKSGVPRVTLGRRIGALYVLTRRTTPKYGKRYLANRRWLHH